MLLKWKTKWDNLRLSGKMLLVYLLLLSVICCVTVVTIQVNLSVYEEKLYEKSVQELDFFVGRVNDSLADVESFSYSEIYGQITRLRYTIFGIFAVMFALSVLIMRRLARAVTQPLQTLTRSMQVVETGDFKAARAVLPEQTSADETGQLTQEFRVMLEKIDLLIYENYEKQLLLQEMRYQMLQAQINPHFLNNTLNTVPSPSRRWRRGNASCLRYGTPALV